MLGTDNKTISQLGIEGIIKAERRPSRRQRYGSSRSIMSSALTSDVSTRFAVVRLLIAS